MSKLAEKTLREIHAIVLASNSLHDAAIQIGVSDATLSSHLAKLFYTDAEGEKIPLSYEVLKTNWPTEAQGIEAFGSAYDVLSQTVAVNLHEKTLREIHAVVLASNSLHDTANKLGVRNKTLSRYLPKLFYTDAEGKKISLSYEVLKTNWPTVTEGIEAFGAAYDEPSQTLGVNLQAKTLRQIHAVVLASSSLSNAAARIGVADKALSRHLAKLFYTDPQGEQKPLSYEVLKTNWPSEDAGFHAWQESYDKPLLNIVQSRKRTWRNAFGSNNLVTPDFYNSLGQNLGGAPLKKHKINPYSFFVEQWQEEYGFTPVSEQVSDRSEPLPDFPDSFKIFF